MYIYRSKCRFPFLIAINNRVIEVFPNQILESEIVLDYPNLILEEKENVIPSTQNTETSDSSGSKGGEISSTPTKGRRS